MSLPTFTDLTPPPPPTLFEATREEIAESWANWWGVPPEMVVLSNTGLQALPLLPAGNPDGTGRVPGVLANPWHVGHPIFYLDAAAKERIRYSDGALETAEAWTARIHLECVYRNLLDVDTGEWVNVLAMLGMDPDRPEDREAIDAYAAGAYVEKLATVEFGPPDASIPATTVQVTRSQYPPDADRAGPRRAVEDPDAAADAATVATFRTLHGQLVDALSPSPTSTLLLAQAFARLHTLATHGGDDVDLHRTARTLSTVLQRVVRTGGQAWDVIGNPPLPVKLPDATQFDLDRITRRVTVAGLTGGAATAVTDLRTLAEAVAAWSTALDVAVSRWQVDERQRRAREAAHAARWSTRTAPISSQDLLAAQAVGPADVVSFQ